jgi:hypothetical protein
LPTYRISPRTYNRLGQFVENLCRAYVIQLSVTEFIAIIVMTLVTPRDLSWFTFAKSVAILAPKRLKVGSFYELPTYRLSPQTYNKLGRFVENLSHTIVTQLSVTKFIAIIVITRAAAELKLLLNKLAISSFS